MTSWDFDSAAQAQLNQHTHMIYYNSQMIETDQRLKEFITDEMRTRETISRMSEIIAAQSLPVCLVVTGDDLCE